VSRQDQIAYAKKQALLMAEKGYVQKARRNDITVLGQEALGLVYVGADSMTAGKYMSEHDRLVSEKLGFVLAGGDLTTRTEVTEDYLLALERKAFIELCQEKKTLERMESLVKTGKILRN
jgi:3-hydroxyacyl-CoA dehydrogenase